jgi:hypothetical protein
MYSYE